jgi:hypothetical protein
LSLPLLIAFPANANNAALEHEASEARRLPRAGA